MSNFLKAFCLLVSLVAMMMLSSHASAASGDLLGTVCGDPTAPQYNSPACIDARKTGINDNPVAGPHGIIQTAANIIALAAGIVAIFVIIAGGIVYATAGGAQAGQRAGDNPTKAKNARQMIINALIGLVVIALVWTITSFVIRLIG